jgi:hypothetical protein
MKNIIHSIIDSRISLQAELVDYYKNHPGQDPSNMEESSTGTDDGENIAKRPQRDPLDAF